MEPETLSRSPVRGIWQDVIESSNVEQLGFVAMFIAFALVAVVMPYFARSRRRFLGLLGFALVLGVGGYVTYDYDYVFLHLAARDLPTVRSDCDRLIQLHRSTTQPHFDWPLDATQLPPSFLRMGAISARVTRDNVQIRFYEDWNGGAWGLFYHPGRSPKRDAGYPHVVRSTLYRDFYKFRVRGG